MNIIVEAYAAVYLLFCLWLAASWVKCRLPRRRFVVRMERSAIGLHFQARDDELAVAVLLREINKEVFHG